MIYKPNIIIITNLDDFAADYLIIKIIENNVNYLRINSEDISKWKIKYVPGNGILLEYENSQYILNSVCGIYFRRAPTIFSHFKNKNNINFLWRESKEFFEGIYLTINANWINPIFETYRAERKLFQLKIAETIGFKIPKSMVTNNPSELKKFISEQESVIKPISHGLQINENEVFSIYTSFIDKDIKFSSDNLFETPIYVQEKIQNEFDIRITIIGENIFPVRIKKNDDNEIDWRKPNLQKDYQYFNLPPSIIKMCFDLNKKLGLKYSAIDMIKSKNNEYTFLEVNPAGEWVWLERELGLPLSQKLIEELTK